MGPRKLTGFHAHMSSPSPHSKRAWFRRGAGKGAQFRVVEGTRKIFIKCADDDSTKACVDALGPLFNKLLETK